MTVLAQSPGLGRWTSPSGLSRLLLAAIIGFVCYLIYRSSVTSSYPYAEAVSSWKWRPSPTATEDDTPAAPFAGSAVAVTASATVKIPAKPINPLPTSNPYTGDIRDRLDRKYVQWLIVPTLKEEDTSWIQNDLDDVVGPDKRMQLLKYVVDDDTAPLRPAINKGHEAMVYLTYMIDFYDALPDVSIFIHAHRDTWHNVGLLDQSTPNMVRRLNAEKVYREGYFNLRCEWEPGCPSRIQVNVEKDDDTKAEQKFFAKAFPELFPGDATPDVLAQPCCAQFALSRDKIRSVPKDKYAQLRDWITNTELEDSTSGRMLEYTWQYLFTKSPTFCPDQHLCLCDGYGVCFPDWNAFNTFEHLCRVSDALNDELNTWRDIMKEHEESLEKNLPEGEGIGPPEAGRGEFLERQLDGIWSEIERRKRDAFSIGEDRERRIQVLSDAWEELDRHPKGNG